MQEVFKKGIYMTIADKLRELTDRYGDKTALRDMKTGKSITFKEINEQSDKARDYFIKNNFKKGDKIVVFIPLGIEFYIILTGIFKCGMQAVFIDPYAGIGHINRCCEAVSPQGVIGSRKILLLGMFAGKIRKTGKKIDYMKMMDSLKKSGLQKEENKDGYRREKEIKIDSSTPALISFTSGSTGFPKVIMRTHGFLLGQHNVLEKNLKFEKNKGVFSAFPMFLLSHMASGETTVIPHINYKKPAKTESGYLLGQIEKSQAQNIILPPSVLENLVNYMEKNRKTVKGIKTVYTGGTPVFPKLMDSLRERLPECRIRALYGASEAEPISLLNHEDITEEEIREMKEGRGLLAGNKVDEIHLKIDDKTGEILVKGENVLKEYYSEKENSENGNNEDSIDTDRWHKTGDTGYINNNGRLFLLGRLKGVIKIGEKVHYPFSVETAFSFCKGIRKTALASKEDRLYLIIEREKDCKRNLNEDREILRLKEKFGIYKLIEGKIPVDKRHNSKVDYKKLEKMIKRNL